jgi:hypothetical protein
MARSRQKFVRTLGNDAKYDVAGALDAHRRNGVWTDGFWLLEKTARFSSRSSRSSTRTTTGQ